MRKKKSRPAFSTLLLGSLLVIILLAAIAAIGGSAWINNFLRSEDFRSLVSEKTGTALRSEVDFQPFQWSGANVYSDRMTANGLEGSVISKLEASQVRAAVDWRAVWDGAWRVSSLDILELQATLRKPSPHEVPPSPAETGSSPGWLPSRFELGFLRTERGTLIYENQEGRPEVTVRNSMLSLEPRDGTYTVSAKHGTLEMPNLPILQIDSAQARIAGGNFFLTSADLRPGSTGKVHASGEFGTTSRLQITCEDVDVTPLLNPQLRPHLTGKLAGESKIEWPENRPFRAEGRFLLTEARLDDVPVLNQIATFTSSPQFRRMPLQEVSGNFVRDGEDLQITNFLMESKGLLKMTGSFTVGRNNSLNGSFLVGVSPQVLQWVPGSRDRVFTENRDGYVWTPMKVSGSLEDPKENLTRRLVAAMAGEVIEQGARALDSVPDGVKDGVREGAKGLLDAVSPLLGR